MVLITNGVTSITLPNPMLENQDIAEQYALIGRTASNTLERHRESYWLDTDSKVLTFSIPVCFDPSITTIIAFLESNYGDVITYDSADALVNLQEMSLDSGNTYTLILEVILI